MLPRRNEVLEKLPLKPTIIKNKKPSEDCRFGFLELWTPHVESWESWERGTFHNRGGFLLSNPE